jgi:hypothetical protein
LDVNQLCRCAQSKREKGVQVTATTVAKIEERDQNWAGRTIVGIPFESPHAMTSLVLDQPEAPDVRDLAVERKLFKVRLADTDGRRNSASMLIRKMYSWRGYNVVAATQQQPNRITLVASHEDVPVATISIGFDSEIGLLVDDLYKSEIDPLRVAGLHICEFTKLAVDGAIRSKRVLASIFHIAYIYAHRIHNYSDLFVEVNPRHVKFYEKMLGFEQFGPEKQNPRVVAPAVLLRLNFEHAQKQIGMYGGHSELAGSEKSLYPYFFSVAEEAGIAGRLRRLS